MTVPPEPEPWDAPPPGWHDQNSGSPPGIGDQVMILVTIGDIACTQTEVITPTGRCAIGSATWTFTDMSRTTKEIPTWAIVCMAIFLFSCLLGLLFLLAREERTEGFVQVVVQGPGFLHHVQLPVSSVAQIYDLNARVGYARGLSSAAAQG
jgi:hypothetical protein